MGVDYDRFRRSPAFPTVLITDLNVAWGGCVDKVLQRSRDKIQYSTFQVYVTQ
jgi:hypothetical protein